MTSRMVNIAESNPRLRDNRLHDMKYWRMINPRCYYTGENMARQQFCYKVLRKKLSILAAN